MTGERARFVDVYRSSRDPAEQREAMAQLVECHRAEIKAERENPPDRSRGDLAASGSRARG